MAQAKVLNISNYGPGGRKVAPPEGYYLSPEEYEDRLDDLRGALIHSPITVAEMAAITRLHPRTISDLLCRITKRPHNYTIERLRMALGRPHPDEDLRAARMNRFVGAWLREYRKKQAKKRRQRAERRAKAKRTKTKAARKRK